MKIEVILTPAEIANLSRRDLSTATCIVFDVLRATSTMLTALANGARRIYPVSTVDEALDLKNDSLPQALLGGERDGVLIEGFDLGNSPGEYTPDRVADRDIISTTTNGTVALKACVGAKFVLAGAWLNLSALAVWLQRLGEVERLLLVCAGTGERFALEDGLAVGGLLAKLIKQAGADEPSTRSLECDDAATAMLATYEASGMEPLDVFRHSANGRRLEEIGLRADVEWCAATSRLPWVAVMRDGALEGEFIEGLD